MLLSLVQSLFPSSSSSPSPSTFQSKTHASIFQTLANPTSSSSPLLPKSLFPDLDSGHALNRLLHVTRRSSSTRARRFAAANAVIQASLLESPVLWAGRVCVFYALLKIGLAGSKANPLVSELDGEEESRSGGGSGAGIAGAGDLGFSKWIESIQGNPDKEASDKRKLVSKWHPTTKGTLRRNYRVPSKSEGRRLLKSVAALLSEDDHFTDATSHKGCQIRRESAHGESVCCNNVRALFDELPTPHLVVEITPFPVGSLTEKDYLKAEKLERVLRSGPSV